MLRDIPLTNNIPGVCGLAKVREIDFPLEEQQKLKKLTGKNKAVFFLPNHPEFFTDWMIDKYVLTRIAPRAACWAAGSIVNGMGKIMQRFWLSNHLIAQLPGHSQAGKDYSVEAAISGQGVLLHPEGQVNWFGNTVSSVYPGAAEMAINAYIKGSAKATDFQSWLAPMVWKIRFDTDVKTGLLDECRYLENRLQIHCSPHNCPARRVYDIYRKLAVRDYRQILGCRRSLANRHLAGLRNDIIQAACAILGSSIAHRGTDHLDIMRITRQWLARHRPSDANYDSVKQTLRRCQRWVRLADCAFSDALISQEQIAEHLKRLRADFCVYGFKDRMSNLFPQPAGTRTAYIRAVKPLAIHNLFNRDAGTDPVRIMAGVRQSMQQTLNMLVNDLENKTPGLKVMNPFYTDLSKTRQYSDHMSNISYRPGGKNIDHASGAVTD